MNYYDRHPVDIRLLAVAVSLLLSGLMVFFHSTPNDDAYTYIRTAEIFSTDGFAAAFAYYEWATYSILIGCLRQLLGIDLFTAAYLLNGLFYALLVYSFISIVKEIDDSKRVLILAAITVLVYPQLNEFRQEVIRDIGFWSLAIYSLWQFMVFGRTHSFHNVMAFCLAMLFAATLRAEAVLYLLAIPLSLLFDTRLDKKRRIKFTLQYTAVSLALLILAILIFRLGNLNLVQLFLDNFSVYTPFISSFLFPTGAESLELGRAIFNEHAANYSSEYLALFILAGLFAILLANLFNGIGGPFLIVLALGYFRKFLAIERHNFIPLLTILLVNTLILLLFILVTRFLASRYTMLFCIVLSIFVPIVLDRILQRSEGKNNKLLTSRIIAVFLLYCCIDAYITFGNSKNYLYDAAEWVSINSEENTSLITNNHAVAYFSGKKDNYDLTVRNLGEAEILQATKGSLIAVETNVDMTQLFETDAVKSRVEAVITFPDENDQQLIIYRKVVD
ncbi:MAG: hypothetical protein JKY98_12090 [Gammaproteobacteria bacterium]|nr:hypothetical protein [Gammaproteobacteria bacterium]